MVTALICLLIAPILLFTQTGMVLKPDLEENISPELQMKLFKSQSLGLLLSVDPKFRENQSLTVLQMALGYKVEGEKVLELSLWFCAFLAFSTFVSLVFPIFVIGIVVKKHIATKNPEKRQQAAQKDVVEAFYGNTYGRLFTIFICTGIGVAFLFVTYFIFPFPNLADVEIYGKIFRVGTGPICAAACWFAFVVLSIAAMITNALRTDKH